MSKTIFLDMDGVLNSLSVMRGYSDTDPSDAAYYQPEILPDCVRAFNRIIGETEAKIVLSSSWRYMIHGGSMTLQGFQYLLKTHGVRGWLIGMTRQDKDDEPRWFQIRDWLRENRPTEGVQRYCILDDDPDAFGGNYEHGVRTNGNGLTEDDARTAIRILNG